MTPDEIRKYLLRSYTAVDGLWFVKTEERFGFDAALDIDAQVWEVMPKIQARQIKAFLGVRCGLDALRQCYTEKLSVEQFGFTVQEIPNGFEIHVAECPWTNAMVRANRTHLAARIGNRICTAEYSAWAEEFGCAFRFGEEKKICEGHSACILRFEEK